MKKVTCILCALMLLILAAWAWAGNTMVVAGGTPAGGGSSLSWTNCIFFLTAEANDTATPYTMSVTDDYSAGDSTGNYVESGVSITATGPLSGTYSFIQSEWGYLEFAVSSNDIFPSRTGAIGFWYNYSALPSGTDYFIFLDGDNNASVRVSSTGEITFAINDGDGTKTYATTDAALTTGVSYFIEILFAGATGTVAIYVNNVAKTVTGSDTFAATTGYTVIYIGDTNNEGGEGKWDNVMIFNTNMRLWDFRSAAYGD